MIPSALFRPAPLFSIAAVLRLTLLVYGIWQDANSALKYTDIDYLVFTDASRLLAKGQSPYDRDTYRYTPLLAWLLLPTAGPSSSILFSFGKVIYPFIYAPAIVWWMDAEHTGCVVLQNKRPSAKDRLLYFITLARVELAVTSLATFMLLNILMYSMYGHPFLLHTYLHHVTRIDHRHNFSAYNTLLYLNSAATDPSASSSSSSSWHAESLAFLPQLLLACLLIPLAIAKKDLATSMLAQTFAFVTFNKVCTSQYFLWYMVFLPLYLPSSSLLRNPRLGISALLLWVGTQAAWLQQGYQLEFLGNSTFFPGLWLSSLAFFATNCWILGIIISDGASGKSAARTQ
ncbi:unnamed protein product [Clonostachys rosea f. rosea IK726]|uniref:GPI mannosyltransferase 1 n=2 Tax=Bionectria ochroleuca TaxID=29856 RepID=A0A0B7JIV0_BIOOC|nr:unnamed protein product [Clonostachys rosea f. rosea IK726]